MTIQFASDLHLEFPENRKFIQDHPLIPMGDVLLLAGDIVPFAVMDQHQDFFDYVSDHFQYTWWIPGNHEYYHSDIRVRSGYVEEHIRSNVTLVNNLSTTVEGVRYIFSTMWTHIRPAYQWDISMGMNDFKLIRDGQYPLSVDQYNQLHHDSLDFIRAQLHTPFDGATVVMTHHVPTYLHYPEKYRGDKLNEGFAIELYDLIHDTGPDFWIYGHHHCHVEPFTIGNTQLITNQMGYVRQEEHRDFSYKSILTI